MKQKTKLKLVNKIASFLTLENKLNRYQQLATWAHYIFDAIIFQICLLISIIEPQLKISETLSKYLVLELTLIFIRIIIASLYLATRSAYILPLIKCFQIINIYIDRTSLAAVPLIIQFIAEMYLTIRKQKRKVNFDSRLQNTYFGIKIFSVYLILLSTFITNTGEIDKNPSAVFFGAIIYYVASCLDTIYSYKTKQILRSIAMGLVLLSIYFMCIPYVPVFNNFTLFTHCLLSSFIFFIFIFYSFTNRFSYTHQILHKSIINLESRDKIIYIWSLIYFTQNNSIQDLLSFIKNHQSQCSHSLCALNFKSDQIRYEILKQAIRTYLMKTLERFSSESDQIRRLFIYYRHQDDPKILYLLKQNDIYERIEEIRISRNIEDYNDISLQYEQMKEIQNETLAKVKLYLNNYDYFLSYISKDNIKLETTEKIISQLIKLKTYFLLFSPTIKDHTSDENTLKKSKQPKSNNQGYFQIQSENIPIKKMTSKTTVLVNFMRKVYFNLPLFEKQQSDLKGLNYISQDYEQHPILVISAESYNLGKIMNWNTTAQKKLLYSTKQIKTKVINDLLPKNMHLGHEKIFMKASLAMQIEQTKKTLQTSVFAFTKSGYLEIFKAMIQGSNSISGNKWIAELKMQYENQSCIVADEDGNIVGINKNAVNFGFKLSHHGQPLEKKLFQELKNNQNHKVSLQKSSTPVQQIILRQDTVWQVVSLAPRHIQLPTYYIILIESAYQIQKLTLSRFVNHNKQEIQNKEPGFPSNKFEFKFDPFKLKFTANVALTNEKNDANIQQAWKQYRQDNFQQLQERGNLNDDDEPNIIQSHPKAKGNKNLYGQNIHQMIYYDHKLEFKQNFELHTEFQTHPHFISGRIKVVKDSGGLGLQKQNFVENIRKIQSKTPTFIYKLIAVALLSAILFIIIQSIRFTQFNDLYELTKQKQLILIQQINRKNLMQDIGSLAVYHDTINTYPAIWECYSQNNWTFESLFVEIQYTNANLNELNSQIGSLINKQYLINTTAGITINKTLASYFQSLSIQASSQSVGELNLTKFILEIVNDIYLIENSIQLDTEKYYLDEEKDIKKNIFILDSATMFVALLSILLLHIVLKNIFEQKIQIFKSLSVIQEQEITKIQKNLSNHRQRIKQNELDVIIEDDYSQSVQSQNIPHTKKLTYSYLNSQIIFRYISFVIFAVFLGFMFLISTNFVQKADKIQLVNPFINIVGQQRKQLQKVYLKIMSRTYDQTIQDDILYNVKIFEGYKKGIIDNLVKKQFSSTFMDFYNNIWFHPCTMLNIENECNYLFSGILSNNLDYNYIYVLTQIEKIINYSVQMNDPTILNNPNYLQDLYKQIILSMEKSIFYFLILWSNYKIHSIQNQFLKFSICMIRLISKIFGSLQRQYCVNCYQQLYAYI